MLTHSPDFWDAMYVEGRDYPNVSPLLLKRLLAKARQDGRLSEGRGRAIDLGCGTGDFARQLSRHDFAVTAVDFSVTAIAKAAQATWRETVAYKVADLESYKDGRYDLVTMKLVFAFLKDRPGMLERIKEMLEPNGVFLLIAPILVADEEYNEHIRGISDNQAVLEQMLATHFRTVQLYSEQYFAPNGIAAHYLLYP